jgi:hypothetical protein
MQKPVQRLLILITMWTCLVTGSALAQARFGLRVGAGADPDQFHFGAHLVTDPLINRLAFRPNLEIGVGNQLTAIAANFELAYSIPLPKLDFSAYIGAGPALNIYRFGGNQNRSGETDTGGGFNILLGLQHREGLFGEFKVGAIDSPEFKFTIGYTFKP